MFDQIDVRHAVAEGDEEKPADPWHLFVWLTILAVALCFVVAILIRPADRLTFHFEENGVITALSVVMLSMSAGFALAISLLRGDQGPRAQAPWALITAGLAFLAFDEHAELHERIGGWVETFISTTAYGLPTVNDLMMIGYGLAALPALVWVLPELARWQGVIRLLVIAALFFGLHTAIDAIDLEGDPVWFIVEETAKIIAVACIFLAILKSLLSATTRMRRL